jgi:hypothetical protein
MSEDLGLLQRTGTGPRVNLLPPGVGERRALRRQRLVLVLSLAGVVVLLGGLALLQANRARTAERRAGAQEAVVNQLQADKAALQPYATLEAKVRELETIRAGVYRDEIRFSTVLQDFSLLVPDKVWLTQLTLTVGTQAAATPGTAPAGGAATSTPPAAAGQAGTGQALPGSPGYGSPVASITFAGSAFTHPDVARFIESMDGTVKKSGQAVYMNPYYTSSTRQGQANQPPVTFTGTVDLSSAAHSGRFQPSTAGGGAGAPQP